ncbi:MAG: hypothetical protein IBJ11_10040 [Phycisphaerales bacterium]|nr:hypothetical protein [Phycisphaerales bacterium]
MPALVRWFLSLGPTNPIVVRLVQGGSRRMRHMYIRTAYLAVLIVVLLFVLLQVQGGATNFRDLAASGARAFELVAYLQIALICVLAPVFMAGAIAQESNPRTWDILLTTPMTSMQMVLGNLLGRLFFVLALLMASLPLFAITQYFGGVPGSSVLASYAVSACAAVLVGAIAIALAVNRLAGRRAVFAFYVSVVTYLAVTMVIDLQLRQGGGGVTAMTPVNPFLALRALLSPSTYPVPEEVALRELSWLARLWFGRPVLAWCLLSGGLSALLVAVSATTVRAIGGSVGQAPWYRRMFGLGARDSTTRTPRYVWQNPIAWREAAARAATLPKMLLRWGFVLAGALWALALLLWFHFGGMTVPNFRLALIATIFTELLVIVLVAINQSATAISREREDGTLDLLLTTPITPRDYLNGKLRGLIGFVAPLLGVPLFTMALAGLYVAAGGFGRTGGVEISETAPGGLGRVVAPVLLPEAALLLPPVTLAFVAFCIMVGLQWSLKSKGTIASVVATVGVVGSIGGVIGLCGWQAAGAVQVVGPVIAAANPLTLVYASVEPLGAFAKTASQADLVAARIAMAVGVALAVALYAVIVTGMRASMVRTFDVTTRRLAGSA